VQLTKEILFPAIEELKSCLHVACAVLPHMIVRENILDEPQYKYLFTVEKVNELVNEGTPFREAYRQVGNDVADGNFDFSGKLNHTHEGSIGRLCTAEIKGLMDAAAGKFK
jgi:argininosuccinate lyase